MIRQKRLLSTLITFVVMFQLLGTNLLPAKIVKAAGEWKTNFITSLEVTKNSVPLGSVTNVAKNTQFDAEYTWTLDPGAGSLKGLVNSGESFEVEIPDEIELVNNDVRYLHIDKDGSIISTNSSTPPSPTTEDPTERYHFATVTFTKPKTIKIEFTGFIETNDIANTLGKVIGGFNVEYQFIEEKIDTKTDNIIDFNYGINIPIKFAPDTDPTISKSIGTESVVGDYVEIPWTVTINGKIIQGAVFEDKIEYGEYKADSATLNNSKPSPDFDFVDGDTLKYTFNSTTKATQTIKYITRVPLADVLSSTNGYSVSNTAKITNNDKSISSNTESKNIKASIITKSGTPNVANNTVDWTINVKNITTGVMSGAEVTDTITSSDLTLDKTTVMIKVGSGSATALPEGSVTPGYTYDSGTKEFVAKLPNIPSGETATITFKTKVADSVKDNNQTKTYTNDATFKWGTVTQTGKSGNVTFGSTMISKSATNVNVSNQEIAWRVVINSNKILLKNAVFTDPIPTGQEYIADSFTISPDPDGMTKDNVVYTPVTGNITKTGELTYTFPPAGDSNTYTITYKTKVTDINKTGVNAANQDIINTGYLTGTGIAGSVNSNTTGTAKYTSEVISKNYLDYDHVGRKIKWQIAVNSNGMEINELPPSTKGPVISDTLSDYLEYVPGTFTIDGKNIIDDPVDVAALGEFKYQGKTLTFEFKDKVTKKHIITFETEVQNKDNIFGKNSSINIENSATIVGKEIPNGLVGIKTGGNYEKSYPFKNNITSKSAVSSSSAVNSATNGGFIDWKIDINVNSIINALADKNFKDAVIEDIIPDGLNLDKDTVVLNKLVMEKDGTYSTTKTKMDLGTDYEIEYGKIENSNKKMFRIKFSDTAFNIAADNEVIAYELLYTTTITNIPDNHPAGDLKFTNAASFKANATSSESIEDYSGDISSIKRSAVGAWAKADKFKALGKTESAKVKKVDSNRDAITSNPAKFILLDENGDFLQEGTTDANGELVFEGLKLNTDYTLQEVEAPTGYVKSNKLETFEITTAGVTKEIEFENRSIKGSIEFIKVSDSDSTGLTGAEFELSSKTAPTVVIDTETSDTNGTVRFENVEYGKYIIKETKAPTGYSLSTKTLEATISKDGDSVKATVVGEPTNSSFVNKEAIGSIEFTKTDSSKKPLKGAEFKIYKKGSSIPMNDGTDDITATSDDNGVVKFTNIHYGDYEIKETKAPSGYYLSGKVIEVNKSDTTKFNFDTTTDAKAVTYEFSADDFINNKITASPSDDGVIKLKKVNQEGQPLQGVEFSLIDSNENIVAVQLTDSNGALEFKNLKYGSYTVKETKVLNGYNLFKDVLTAEVNSSNKVYDIGTVTNTKVKANIQINKVDEKSKPLQGGEFTLYDSKGKAVKSATSNSKGVVLFEGIEYGDYTVKETKAPKGYEISKDVVKVSITNSDIQTFTVENKPTDNPKDPEKPGEGETPGKPGDGGKPGDPNPGQGGIDTPGKGSGTGSETPGKGGSSNNGGTTTNTNDNKYGSGKDKYGNKIPQTGRVVDTKVLTALGLTAVAAGTILLIKNRRKGEES